MDKRVKPPEDLRPGRGLLATHPAVLGTAQGGFRLPGKRNRAGGFSSGKVDARHKNTAPALAGAVFLSQESGYRLRFRTVA